MVSDPIGDFIIRLKNAAAVGHTRVAAPYSLMLFAIAEKLKDRGFITVVEKKMRKTRKVLEVEIAYRSDGAALLRGVDRISKPGRRLYGKSTEMHQVHNGRGVLMVSTPGGVMTGEEARAAKMGGELLFTLW